MMERILDIKNLRISFRTNNGRVKAVRNISFELNKGETIAIVGESGSGKSVTARALMGILAPNAIVEGGEILYDGMDLMKITEEEFHQLRGNRISMIFQDPLSSLNPIVKIGKQLTEAMILNGRSSQRDAKKIFNKTTALLEQTFAVTYEGDSSKIESGKKNISILKKFIEISNKHQFEYNQAREKLDSCISEIKGIQIDIIGKKSDVQRKCDELSVIALKVLNPFIIDKSNTSYQELVGQLKSAARVYSIDKDNKGLVDTLNSLLSVLESASKKAEPNFFTLGYYLTYENQPKSLEELSGDIPSMNSMTRKYIDENYMLAFLKDIAAALKYSEERAISKRQNVLDKAEEMIQYLNAGNISTKELKLKSKELIKIVEDSIDSLDINKDSTAYTFKWAMASAVNNYITAIKLKNKKVRSRVEKIAYANTDYDLIVSNLIIPVTRIEENYKLKSKDEQNLKNYDDKAVALVDFLKEQSAKMVYCVTKAMAKTRAIQLMEEVGIPEARKRYNQYPFEFSGGMRQRIVIAIALSANPDILICDEPTTALDVTIQSQILELINGLKEKRKLSVIFITHDLGVVANMADKIAVMYAGKIVEYGDVEEIFYDPRHPYTWALLSSMPDIYTEEKLEAIPGTPPNMIIPPVGDAFAARNKFALKIDFEQHPPMFQITDTHYAATWLLHPDAPKVEPPKIVTERIARMKNLEAKDDE
ncbi:oligopeptide/dipeptide ABC transporter ATP-binding protein [Lachnoclostridium sp.]|uniref:oligopeptide/dipeptide ABC transporter ATP-binding protein n=1 Tax=Lachnoclostridium sp. TaxID=2028282 RepID=UPI002F3FE85B